MKVIKSKIECLLVALVVLTLAGGMASAATASLKLDGVSPGSYKIVQDGEFDVIQMENFAMTESPGEPMLPHKVQDILLPPDVIDSTVKVSIVSATTRSLDRTYNIKPAGFPVRGDNKNIVNGRNVDIYQSNADYPASSVKLLCCSQMRKWKFARVDFIPFQYNPVTGKLTVTESVEIEISYSTSPSALKASLMGDTVWQDIAAKRFINYAEVSGSYVQPMSSEQPSPSQPTYVIITTNAINAGSTKLDAFVTHKQNLGYNVLVVIREVSIDGLVGQAPNNRAEKIREWLKNNYISEGIQYVLLIGDPHPFESGEGDIPMKMCHPERNAYYEEMEQTPTDYFYADLTGNWDIDGDQFYGEWDPGNGSGDYPVIGGVDFTPEVYVGRIPVYNSDYTTLDSILQKLIDYESASGDISWRASTLLPMGFQAASYDGAQLAEQMRNDYILSAGYSTWRMYQQGTAYAADNSIYTSDEELRGSPATPNVKDRWSSTDFGIVCWWAHGSSTSASVGYSPDWDGTLFLNTYCSSLDDNYPAFTYQCSCTNGYPEASNNLQYAILKRGGIGTVSATRVSWFSTGVGYGEYDGSVTNSGIGYEYVDRLVQNLGGGDALYQAKSSMSPNGHQCWLMNWYDFNLYGDPSLRIIGEGPQPKPPFEHIKWSQPPVEIDPGSGIPIYCGWDEPSYFVGGAPPCAVIEDFEDGDKAEYTVLGGTHNVTGAAAHDGRYGLESECYGVSWIYRTDAAVQLSQGDTVSYWVKVRVNGRAYCGFGASANGTYSIVAAPNTNQLLLQLNESYGYLDIGTSPQTWTLDKWYRLEVEWSVGGNMTGRLYDSDGTTLLNTVTATDNTYTSGGIAFRAFDENQGGVPDYFDTVERCSSASSAARELMASRLPSSANIAKHNPVDAIGWDEGNKAYIFPKAETKVNKLDTIAEIRKQAMSASVNVPAEPQKTNLGQTSPVTFKGHILSTNSSPSGSCGSILYAPAEDDNPSYRAAVSAACGGATVDYYDARAGTPDVALLSTYDCVFTWVDYAYADKVAFGNNLADYVDAGGKVILGQWCYQSNQNSWLEGRIMTAAYCPVTVSESYKSGSYAGDGTDCVHDGVTAYDTSYLDIATLLPGNLSDGTFTITTGGSSLSVAWRPDRQVYYSAGNTGTGLGTGDWPQLLCNMCCCGGVAPSKMVADDFRCVGNMPITSIHWWGSYVGWEGYEPPRPQPVAWQIGFWSNVPAASPPCVVVPNACASVEGDAANAWPFNLAYFGMPSMRYQQIYDEAEVGQSGTITQIRFRPDVDFGNPFGPSSMDVAIYLGYSANPVSSPSPSFAKNIGAGYTLVYSGILTLSSTDTGGPPRNFDIVVDVDDNFTYNPSAGPLLLDVYMYTSPSTTFFDADGVSSGQTGTTRIYSTGSVDDLSGIVNFNGSTSPPYGLVTMLCFDGATPSMSASTKTTDVPAADREPYEADGVTGAIKGSNPNAAKDRIAEIRKQAMSASVNVPAGPQKTLMGEERPITFTGHVLTTDAPAPGATCSSILFVFANADDPDYRAAISAACGGATVDYYDARVGTPSVALLSTYDCVHVQTNYVFFDNVTLGDNLADYVDAGGKVVLGVFCTSPPWNVAGRIMTVGYCPVNNPTGSNHYSLSSYAGDGTTCIHNGITNYDCVYRDYLQLQGSGLQDGSYLDGEIAHAYRPDFKVIYSNGCGASVFGGTGQWPQLICNACCCGGPTPPRFSYPEKLLWQIVVPADRVDVNNVGRDYFPERPPDTCFRYDVQLNPNEYFWQGTFEPKTRDNIFWLSISAIYPTDVPSDFVWGWKTRPWSWMDDAVTFRLEGPFEPGITLDPTSNNITPLEGLGDSYDVAFELDTDPNWIKWEQPYTGLRNWDSYTDIFSSAIEYEEGLDIYGMAADDWLCQRRTPVSSIVWWGSYMGYMYMPCEPIAEPLIPPDYFLISVWTDVPAGSSQEAGMTSPQIAQIRQSAASASVNVPAGPQKTLMGEERPITFTGHVLTTDAPAPGATCSSILFVFANDDDPGYRAAISAACGGATVDYYDARVGTPSVALLSTYDCVHVQTNYVFFDNVTLGDNLADYVDAGGTVVLGVGSTYPPWNVAGRIMTVGYCPVNNPTANNHYTYDDYASDGTTCIHNDITNYGCVCRDYLELQGSGLQDGSYLDGEIAHAYRPDFKVIYSNGSGTSVFGGTGQWPQLICNMCCCGKSYSHPGKKVWEYKAYDYDEVMVGYDKRLPTAAGADAGSVEPVFRYSARLPEKDWFCQPDVNAIYWLSVVAVWNANEPISNYAWGWTNHEHVFGDDGVQGWPEGSDPNILHWEELIDGQTGESLDLSFMLFTDPNVCCRCANFNLDTIVNFKDYADFADDWLWVGPAGGYNNSDLNCDGRVDWYDVKIFTDQWLSSCP